jgi:hypothetical protein
MGVLDKPLPKAELGGRETVLPDCGAVLQEVGRLGAARQPARGRELDYRLWQVEARIKQSLDGRARSKSSALRQALAQGRPGCFDFMSFR